MQWKWATWPKCEDVCERWTRREEEKFSLRLLACFKMFAPPQCIYGHCGKLQSAQKYCHKWKELSFASLLAGAQPEDECRPDLNTTLLNAELEEASGNRKKLNYTPNVSEWPGPARPGPRLCFLCFTPVAGQSSLAQAAQLFCVHEHLALCFAAFQNTSVLPLSPQPVTFPHIHSL